MADFKRPTLAQDLPAVLLVIAVCVFLLFTYALGYEMLSHDHPAMFTPIH
jgi:hypothetical protein